MTATNANTSNISEDYTKTMQKRMGTSLTYRHEDGMNYAKVSPRLFVGSCPQKPDDVDQLRSEGVDVIFCLQQDSDMEHFSLDIAPIKSRAAELSIEHVHWPIPDFDPMALRSALRAAVQRLIQAMASKQDSQAYVHCTAGLGRAPGVALSYMFWVDGECLDQAYARLFAVRRCHPQIGMIRAATCDMLAGDEGARQKVRLAITRHGASVVEIAGLDIGWKNRIRLDAHPEGEFAITREVAPGTYQYKFIVDGEWMPNPDLPTVNDNGNINNVLEVSENSCADSPSAEMRKRLMAEGGRPTEEELRIIRGQLGLA